LSRIEIGSKYQREKEAARRTAAAELGEMKERERGRRKRR